MLSISQRQHNWSGLGSLIPYYRAGVLGQTQSANVFGFALFWLLVLSPSGFLNGRWINVHISRFPAGKPNPCNDCIYHSHASDSPICLVGICIDYFRWDGHATVPTHPRRQAHQDVLRCSTTECYIMNEWLTEWMNGWMNEWISFVQSEWGMQGGNYYLYDSVRLIPRGILS